MKIKKSLLLILTIGILLVVLGCDKHNKKTEKISPVQKDDSLIENIIYNIKNELSQGTGYVDASVYENVLTYDVYSRSNYIEDTKYERTYFIKNNTICYNDYELTELERKSVITPNELTFEEEIMLDAYVSDEEIASRTSNDMVIYESKGTIKEDTMTIINKNLYFAEYLDNKICIKIYNIEDKNIKDLCVLENDISYLTYISENSVCYLKDKNIYAYLIKEGKEERINTVDNVERFFVCKYGILYSVIGDNGEKIYANNKLILESTQDIEYIFEYNFRAIDQNDNSSEVGIMIEEINNIDKNTEDSDDEIEDDGLKFIYAERLFNNFDAEKDILDSFYE